VELDEVFGAHQKEIYVYFLRTMGDMELVEAYGLQLEADR
jgi:hypothetical protein